MNNRIENVRRLLEIKQINAMLVSSVSNIFYLTDFSNFSAEEREAYLLITKDKQYIFTDGRYKEAIERDVKQFELQLITSDSSFIHLLRNVCQKENIETIGFEQNNITYWEYSRLQELAKTLTPLSLYIRVKKDEEEIEKIQKACNMGDKAFSFALSQIKEGVSEKEIQKHIEIFLKQHNADISFRPIVAFGANSSMPHYESSAKRMLQKNECVLIDMGAKVDGYCSDMTRTVFFGKITEKQKDIYQTVLDSQQKAIEFLEKKLQKNEDVRANAVDKIARDYITEKDYPTIPHSLGHGTGVDVHEVPSIGPKSDVLLLSGMVFSIEPGIYVPDFMGVRIEDLVAIEGNRLKILTLSKKELLVL